MMSKTHSSRSSCFNTNMFILASLLLVAILIPGKNSYAQESVNDYIAGQMYLAQLDSDGNSKGLSSNSMQFDLSKASEFQIKYEDDQMRKKLSTLWTAVTLNMITADLLSLYIPEANEEWEDFADGKESEIMLYGAIMYQLPISMVFLSKVLPHDANRWANIISAGLMSVAVVAGGNSEPHYWVCAGMEVVGMSMIAWNAWHWENPDKKISNVNLGMNVKKETIGLACSFNF